MNRKQSMFVMLLSSILLIAASKGAVLFTENWDSGSIAPGTWNVSDPGATNFYVEQIDPNDANDYALVIEGETDGNVPQWGDEMYSTATYERDGFLTITFKTWQGNSSNQWSCHGGFHHTASTSYNSMEAAIGYLYIDLRAAGGNDGNHGIVDPISYNKMPNFNEAIAGTGGRVRPENKDTALTVRITMGDIRGARWEWSDDDGVTWNVERDTIEDGNASDTLDNYIGFAPFTGQDATAVIDDIVVEENFHLIRLNDGRTDVNEQAPSSDTYTIVLGGSWNPPSQNVTVTVDPDNQLQVNGAGQGSPVNLTFTPSNYDVPQTITVQAVDDSATEGGHVGIISHTTSSGDGNYDGLVIENVTVNIADNDEPGFTITESDGVTDVNEDGSLNDTYTIKAEASPAQTVTVTVDPDDQLKVNGGAAGQSVQLIFNSGNWTVAQEITVSGADDGDSEGPHTGTITHTVQSGDSGWDGMILPDVVADITDDENYCGEPDQVYDEADIAGPGGVGDANRDCYVNFLDFAYMAQGWLDCTDLSDPGCSW